MVGRPYGKSYISLTGLTLGGVGLPLVVEVGRKGYIVLPKAIRELVGIKEGDRLIVKVEGGSIILEPEVNVNVNELRRRLEEHWRRIGVYVKARPKLGELASVSLEEEFEE